MILYIKNMVCIRCKMLVKSELDNLGLDKALVEIGEVNINERITSEQQDKLKIALSKSGFELLDEEKSMLVQKIKSIIIGLVHYSDEQLINNLPDYLSKKLNHDYALLDTLFFEVKNITIENFFIAHKIEKVKELLIYYKLKLPEIAYQMNYTNTTQLYGQLKEVTGFSPSHYQKIRNIRRATQENVRMM